MSARGASLTEGLRIAMHQRRGELFEALVDRGWSPECAGLLAAKAPERPDLARFLLRVWLGVTVGACLSEAAREAVFERDGHTCRECGTSESLTVDHVVPVARGGTDEQSNLQTLCNRCNARKGAR